MFTTKPSTPISYPQARACYEAAAKRGDTEAANKAAADMERAARMIAGRTP